MNVSLPPQLNPLTLTDLLSMLNLGCGQRFHPDWINVNFTSNDQAVIAHNLAEGIPFPDSSFDVVYHSHLLEHFPKAKAQNFLNECRRVLRSQGILRIAVPDLEQILRNYLLVLEESLLNSQEASANHQWLLLELFDQMIREQSGGDMAIYLRQPQIPNKEFIIDRLGTEARNLILSGRQPPEPKTDQAPWLRKTLKPLSRWLRSSDYRREVLLKLILKPTDYQALQIGRFRQGGEIHQWMYDRFSLSKLLEEAGFTQIVQRSATESYVSHWVSYNLDTEPDGSVYKPDSLFMEAIKPS